MKIKTPTERIDDVISYLDNCSLSMTVCELEDAWQDLKAEQQASAVPFDDYPDYHPEAMGCGLEDRGITDRYEAMQYGWDQAIERVAERIQLLYASTQPAINESLTVAEQSQDSVMAAVKNLIAVKGRFHTEQAFWRLVDAYDAAIAQSEGKV